MVLCSSRSVVIDKVSFRGTCIVNSAEFVKLWCSHDRHMNWKGDRTTTLFTASFSKKCQGTGRRILPPASFNMSFSGNRGTGKR